MFMERTPLKNFLSRTLLHLCTFKTPTCRRFMSAKVGSLCAFKMRKGVKTKIKTIEQKVLIICKNILEENPFKKLSFKVPLKNKDKNH